MSPVRLIRRYICEHWHTHERDWGNNHPDRCRHCHAHMLLEPGRTYVGFSHPDLGD